MSTILHRGRTTTLQKHVYMKHTSCVPAEEYCTLYMWADSQQAETSLYLYPNENSSSWDLVLLCNEWTVKHWGGLVCNQQQEPGINWMVDFHNATLVNCPYLLMEVKGYIMPCVQKRRLVTFLNRILLLRSGALNSVMPTVITLLLGWIGCRKNLCSCLMFKYFGDNYNTVIFSNPFQTPS